MQPDPMTGLSTARLGVYVHFPFCLSKCPYCDFASIAAREVPEERYAKALRAELALRAGALAGRKVESIYVGGGTPSLWAPRHVGSLLEDLSRSLTVAADAEVTLEANPGASDAARFAGYRAAGVNRLSLGIQSLQAPTLLALGRAHDADAGRRAFSEARRAGFDNVSVDLIFGVHGQHLAQVEADAREVADWQPEHLSAYALTLDRDSLAEEVPLARALARGEVSLPPDEEVIEMSRVVEQHAARAGLVRYEISNLARPGRHARHNALYWTGGEYLALGAGATGFVRDGERSGSRYANPRSAEHYFAAIESGRLPTASEETLGPRELFEERLAMGLRLSGGVHVEAVCAAFDVPYEPRRQTLKRLATQGLARAAEGRWQLTEQGRWLHSAVSAALI